MKILPKFSILIFLFVFISCHSETNQNITKEITIFNKLQQFLFAESEQSIDSMRVYLKEYEKLNVDGKRISNRVKWVHDSFAQCFVKSQMKDSLYHKEVLNLINDSDFPVFSRLTKGIKIYLEAKNSDKTHDLIKQLNKTLIVSEESLSERYRILLYDLNPKANNEYLLDEVITNSRDILSSSKDGETLAKYRYFIAHSYYLKAQNALNQTHKSKVKKYLELASSYSPDAADRKVAPAYFYEKHFLTGYDDYGKFQNDFLFAEGDSSKVLENLTKKSLINFQLIGELQKLYLNLNPNKPFNEYWKHELKNGLPTAPTFALESYKGQSYKLEDFYGKWIVLDFWGTWCSPCREELPKLQKLSSQINSEFTDKAVVLTIACKDSQKLVNEFMAKNNYDFLVLMSDEAVEKDFKVSSYPSKFLITPDGNYFQMYSNDDWVEIVEAYVFGDELYGL